MNEAGGLVPIQWAMKRVIDFAGASFLLVALSPVMAVCAIAVRKANNGPVLFRQTRPGKNEGPFTLYKFKTMRDPAPGEDAWTSDAARVTKIGAWLRKTSLDELPELYNVIRGDMSLVGPRPLLMEYLPLYSERHRRRHSIRPGLTGLAQVSGRRNLTLSERLDLDVTYIENWSITLDLRILLKTLLEPFGEGANDTQSLASIDDLGFFEGR